MIHKNEQRDDIPQNYQERETAWRVERQADINGIQSLIIDILYFTSAPVRV